MLFAVNGTVSKVALTGSELTAVDYTQLRTTFAFLGLALGLLVLARDKLRFTRRDLPFLAFYGIFSFALVQWLYFVAIERLPIGIALLIQFSGVVLVALWARLVWHVDVRPRVWAALALTLVGLALVSEFWLGWTLDTVGVVACVGAAITLATYLLAGERAVEQRDPLGVLCLSLLFASLLWAVVQPWWKFPTDELAVETSLQGNLDHLSAPVWALRALDGSARHDRAVRALDRRPAPPRCDPSRNHAHAGAGRRDPHRLGVARRDAGDGAARRRRSRPRRASSSPKRLADLQVTDCYRPPR